MRVGNQDESKEKVSEFEVAILFGGDYDRCATYFDLWTYKIAGRMEINR